MVDWVLRNKCIEALESEIENDRKNHPELTYLSNIYREFIDSIKNGEDINELVDKANSKYEYCREHSYEENDDNDCRKLIYDAIASTLWYLCNYRYCK